ncbi:MAG: hypothetical protein QXK12_08815 [Candidatus Nezhaarchaeales archaeon]
MAWSRGCRRWWRWWRHPPFYAYAYPPYPYPYPPAPYSLEDEVAALEDYKKYLTTLTPNGK